MILNQKKHDPSKYVFVIDGNYLMSRMAFATGLDFFKNPTSDSKEYFKALCSGFSKLVTDYIDAIDDVKIAIDGYSWRKKVKMIVPEIYNDLPVDKRTYKANRNVDEVPMDMKVVKTVFNDFADMMKEKYNVPKLLADNAEGDDFLYYAIKKEIENGRKVLLYTSDGDAHQLANENVFILKQMPNDRPNKLVMCESKKDEFYPNHGKETSALESYFGANDIKTSDNLVKYFKEDDIMVATPAEFLLLKSMSGDKKDNIPPTFAWKKQDKNGQLKEFKPTMMFIKKGLERMGKTIEDVTVKDLFDPNFVKDICVNTLKSTPLIDKVNDFKRQYKENMKHVFDKKGDFNQMLIDTVLGSEEKVLAPLYTNTKLDGTVLRPTLSQLEYALEVTEIYMNNNPESKIKLELKNNAFIQKFCEVMHESHPLMRDIDLIVKIFIQNRTLLYLNDKTIPDYVLKQMDDCYESQSNLRCEVSVISDFKNLISTAPVSESMFDAIDDDVEDEESDVTEEELDDLLGGISGFETMF
ncbi:hypothetical protein BPT24_159 [Tenacibaculum phage pT24]|uniref:5'-3' exonuclease alpha-helical arch N-terminal domain-containing protein n=1 Tax=Tenacibaculum phage pT24 TaxID=1880590 RepID=A0A1B4XWV8_9CAUD|nr:hypothetical protein HYP10_gp159 [Tenacibaculum phage pT24]BAV39285.1 hypothetical protein BPT24_159 [Tenacibaculum phage pT24]